MHFSKKIGSSVINGPEILAFGSHCSANFQLILDWFVSNFKLKYEDSEKNRLCKHSRSQLTSNQTEEHFWGHPVVYLVTPPSCRRVTLIFKHSLSR